MGEAVDREAAGKDKDSRGQKFWRWQKPMRNGMENGWVRETIIWRVTKSRGGRKNHELRIVEINRAKLR